MCPWINSFGRGRIACSRCRQIMVMPLPAHADIVTVLTSTFETLHQSCKKKPVTGNRFRNKLSARIRAIVEGK